MTIYFFSFLIIQIIAFIGHLFLLKLFFEKLTATLNFQINDLTKIQRDLIFVKTKFDDLVEQLSKEKRSHPFETEEEKEKRWEGIRNAFNRKNVKEE